VLPEFRGRGIHRALIADRARRAESMHCELITSQASADGVSERNMATMGLVRVHLRGTYPAPTAAAT
jgi:GNAT superfamily N-acetyltransferase